MSNYFFILLASINLLSVSQGIPIEDGVNTGTVQKVGQTIQVIRQKIYPYVVHVDIADQIDGKNNFQGCGGVIIGIKSVLTAGHCLYGKVNPTVIVYAGIVDIKWEAEKAQKIIVEDYKIHEEYQSKCIVGKKCCYQMNDIAIMRLQEELVFGPTVQKAELNGYIKKPVGRKGWIFGWGLKAKNVPTSMLQKGLVQVIPQEECEEQNPYIHITKDVMCLRGFKKTTKANLGDSGGPFVIGGVVFGISSISLKKTSCSKEPVDVYTDVARYSDWIRNKLHLKKRSCENEFCTIV